MNVDPTPRPTPSLVRHGWIADYNEQGMEADFYLTFQDAEFVGPDGMCDREGWFILADGDRLTIHQPNGTVLWSGVIGAPPRSLAGRIARWRQRWIAGRRRWTPEGVSHEVWVEWFRTRPHLRATFVRPASDPSP